MERGALVILFGLLSFNLLQRFQETGALSNLVLLCSEGSVALFVLFRRLTTDISMKPLDWAVATLGTTMPLLVVPSGSIADTTGLSIAPGTLMITGFALQIAAKLTLRRSFGIVAANRGIKIGGPYRFVRHPMYAGYVITHIGFLLFNPTLWNFSVYAIAFGCQIVRILAEERVLLRDEAYRHFATQTRYRLLTGVF